MYQLSRTIHRFAILLVATTASCVSSRHSDRPGMSSRERERAGETDTVYIRRVRMFEQIAASIPKDSLVRLYTGAVSAPPDSGSAYQNGIACQMQRMIKAYGSVAAEKVVVQVEDSLFPPPSGRRRWAEITSRWPSSLGPNFRCDLSDLSRAPDSLDIRPVPGP